MIYPTKKDWWIVLAVVASLLALIVVGIYRLGTGRNDPGTWIVLGVVVFYAVVLLVFAYPMNYEITPSSLVIRCGLLRCEISLSDVEKVYLSRSLLCSAAWSLDRLRVDYRKKGKVAFTLISPENREEFLTELAQTAQGLEREGDQIVRKEGDE